MKIRPLRVVTAQRVEQACRGQHTAKRQHERAQPIENEHDSKWRRPVPQVVDLLLAGGRDGHQPHGNRNQRSRRGNADSSLGSEAGRLQDEKQRTGDQRQQHRRDDPVIHPCASPST